MADDLALAAHSVAAAAAAEAEKAAKHATDLAAVAAAKKAKAAKRAADPAVATEADHAAKTAKDASAFAAAAEAEKAMKLSEAPLGKEMSSHGPHLGLATLKQLILHIWQAKKEDLKGAEYVVNAQILKEKCDKLARILAANVAEMIESFESLLAPESEDISHSFQAVKVAAGNHSGRAKML